MSCVITLELDRKESGVSRTSLAEARGQCRIIPQSQRLNEMQPLEHSAIVASNIERARYCCEIAEYRIANGMLQGALQMLREALLIGCKWQWVARSNKFATTLTDPMQFLVKLRSATFLTAAEFQRLKCVARGKHPRNIFEAKKMIEAVAKVVSPDHSHAEGGVR